MENTLEKIELIMKPYYDKLKENEELFSMTSREKVRIESELKRLSSERLNLIPDLEEKLEYLRDNKDREINSYFDNLSDTSDNLIDLDDYTLKYMNRTVPDAYLSTEDSNKVELINKAYQDYKDEEQDLMKKIAKISEAEKKLNATMSELRKLRLNKQREKEAFLASKVVGKDPTTSAVVSTNYEHIYSQKENSLISKIVELSNIEVDTIKEKNVLVSISDKDALEARLRKVQSILQKEYKNPSVEHIGYRKNKIDFALQNEYVKREQELVSQINKLSMKTEEEIQLEQELDLLLKRPNYDRVYTRELIDLKIELGSVLNKERLRLNSLLEVKNAQKDKIMIIYNERKQRQDELIQEKKKVQDVIQKQIDDFETIYDKNGRATNEDIRSNLMSKNQALAMEIMQLSAQELLEKDRQSELDLLNREIDSLSRTLNQITKNSEILKLTKEEAVMLTVEFTPEELLEYDRRQKEKKIEQNRNIANFDLERQSVNYTNMPTVQEESVLLKSEVTKKEAKVDLVKNEEPIAASIYDSAPSIGVDNIDENDDATLDIDESLEISEKPEAIIGNKEQNVQNYQNVSDGEVETIGETVQQSNKEPFEVNIKYDDGDSNSNVDHDTNSNSDDYYNPSDVPSDLIKYEGLTYKDVVIDGNKIIVDDIKNLVQVLYEDIISNIDSIDTIKLEGSELDKTKLYFSSTDGKPKYYFEGAISPNRIKDRIEYLYGEYVSQDDIMDAFNKYSEVSKGRTYEVTENNKLFSVSESKIREIYREFKKCSILRLEKSETRGMRVSTKEAISRDLIPSGNVETILNEGDYIRKNDLMAILKDTLKYELFKTLSNKMKGTVQGNVSDDFDDVEIDMSDELPNGKHR